MVDYQKQKQFGPHRPVFVSIRYFLYMRVVFSFSLSLFYLVSLNSYSLWIYFITSLLPPLFGPHRPVFVSILYNFGFQCKRTPAPLVLFLYSFSVSSSLYMRVVLSFSLSLFYLVSLNSYSLWIYFIPSLLPPLTPESYYIDMTTNFPPPWITHLLDTTFYETCKEADHQGKHLTTFFCKDCEDNNAFCKNCKNNSNKHGGHEVVQVSFIFPTHGG